MIGDVQGCNAALRRLLQTLDFSPSRDTVYLLGDLVNRGPDSLGVLRWAQANDDAVRCVLGNHDLHLLAVSHGVRPPHRNDTVDDVLQAPDRTALLEWLQQQPLARLEHGWLMVHAGVLPQWDAKLTIALSQYVSCQIAEKHPKLFFESMYGNQPDAWNDRLDGADRTRVVVNALTRLRLCNAQGRMEFDSKEDATQAPPGFMPWFDVPGRLTQGQPIAFGHWSTLRQASRNDVLALDTGCVWGGQLTAARLRPLSEGETCANLELIAVECPQVQRPGKG